TEGGQCRMSEPNPEKEFEEIIRAKALAGNAAPEWLMAFAMMQLVTVGREISETVKSIHSAIDEKDNPGSSLSERLKDVANQLSLFRDVIRGKCTGEL